MKRLYPDDVAVDFAYKISLQTTNFDLYDGSDDETNYGGKIHYNDRNELDLQLLTATDGLRDAKGEAIDYDRRGLTPPLKAQPLVWQDMRRGVAAARSSWEAPAS